MASALSIQGISKSFLNVHAIRNVSFDVEEGEICAVMGENGAGKSTLMNVLSGAIPPSAGTLQVKGATVEFRSPHDAWDAGIAIVHQELNLVHTLTVLENLFIGRIPKKYGIVDWKRMETEARPILARVGAEAIDPFTKVGRLSIGQQQLVEIARVLSMDPAILILDEPTSSLSERDSQRLLDVLRGLRAQGHTILYISHRMHEVLSIADSIVVLRDGRFVTRFVGHEASEDRIAEAMVGRVVTPITRAERPAEQRCVLELKGVTTDDVTEISFRLHAGEIVGLAGLIGSGRTETAKAIFGDARIASGAVLLDGKERRFASPNDAMRAGVCMVPEDRKDEGLNLGASIHENMILPFRHAVSKSLTVSRAREAQIVRRYFDRMAISAPNTLVAVQTLSGGNQQKVVLGKAFAVEPRVIVFDEPTRGVDVAAKAEIHRIIVEAAEAGAAILFISSELPELLAISDRILVMSNGRISGELPRGASEADVMIRAISS